MLMPRITSYLRNLSYSLEVTPTVCYKVMTQVGPDLEYNSTLEYNFELAVHS